MVGVGCGGSAIPDGGGGARDAAAGAAAAAAAAAPNCMERKYLVAACRSCSRSSAVCRLKSNNFVIVSFLQYFGVRLKRCYVEVQPIPLLDITHVSLSS